MSLLIPCPNCGPRPVDEFSYAGELATYLYFRRNVAGVQREWWFHRLGCELWFQAERDTRTNEVLLTEVTQPTVRQES
jgi:sarcosine oxidase delta subunit